MYTDKILILDLGGTQAESTARKLRGEEIFCEILPADFPTVKLASLAPKGLVLAGGTCENAVCGQIDPAVFELGVPVLAMGHAARLMAAKLGGAALGTLIENRTAQITFSDSALFEGLEESERYFERVDMIELPEGFSPIAFAAGGIIPAFANEEKHLYGLQFYTEVNDPDGLQILQNFAVNICRCAQWWSMEAFLPLAEEALLKAVPEGKVLIAISGGVDSAVCAGLMHKVLGERLRCLYIDTGLMREGETEFVASVFRDTLGMDLIVLNAQERILTALQGVTDVNEKYRIVADEVAFIYRDTVATFRDVTCLARGTIYPDILSDPTEDDLPLEHVVEPLKFLFKDEVRMLGEVLGLPRELIVRQPFPASGLAARVSGAVNPENLATLRKADAIFCEEIIQAGLDRKLGMYFALLTDPEPGAVKSGECSVALRAVASPVAATAYRLPYDLLERVTQRITEEVPGVSRVLYDLTGRLSALEWN